MTPPKTTPQASAWPIVGSSGPVPSNAVISDRLSKIGVAAGAAKRPKALSTPPCSAVSEMNSR